MTNAPSDPFHPINAAANDASRDCRAGRASQRSTAGHAWASSRIAIAAGAVAAMLAVGCNVHPERDVAAYKRQLAIDEQPIELGPTLSLGEAIALANRNNESLAIEGEAYVRALADRRRAVSAFYPTAEASPSYSVREKVAGSGGGVVIGGGTGTGTGGVVVGGETDTGGGSGGYDADLNVPLSATWVVFDGLRNVNAYWRDVYLVQRQRARLLEAQEQLIYDVASVYYTIVRAQSQIRVLEQSLGVQGERLRDTRGRQTAGVARPLDVAQTEAQFAGTQVTLIEARRQLADARSLLAYLVNAADVEAMPLDDQYVPPDGEPDVERLLADAMIYRSELRAAERAIAAAGRDVRVAIGQYYPSLVIDLSVFLYRESVPTERTWESLLQLSFPIFSAGRIDQDVRTAWSFLREAQLVANQSRRAVRREVEQGVRDVQASAQAVAGLRVQADAAAEAARQAEAVYQAGRGTNLERVAAQDVQLQAELALATEEINLKVLRINLLRATGRLRESLLDAPPATTRPATQTTQTTIAPSPPYPGNRAGVKG